MMVLAAMVNSLETVSDEFATECKLSIARLSAVISLKPKCTSLHVRDA